MYKKKNIRILFLIVLVILTVVPKILHHQYSSFFNHPLVKTDFDWKQFSVECIMQNIREDVDIPFGVLKNGYISPPDRFTHYSYQYMFSPVILKKMDSTFSEQFVLLVLDDTVSLNDYPFEDYYSFSCSENLFFFSIEE